MVTLYVLVTVVVIAILISVFKKDEKEENNYSINQKDSLKGLNNQINNNIDMKWKGSKKNE